MNLLKYILISFMIHIVSAVIIFTPSINDYLALNFKYYKAAASDGGSSSGIAGESKSYRSSKHFAVEFFSFKNLTPGNTEHKNSEGASITDGGVFNRMVESVYKNDPPDYPLIAKKMGYQGVVSLELEILPDGRCGAVQIAKSSGYTVLDTAAVKAAKSWVFFKNYSILISSPVKVRQDIRFILNSY